MHTAFTGFQVALPCQMDMDIDCGIGNFFLPKKHFLHVFFMSSLQHHLFSTCSNLSHLTISITLYLNCKIFYSSLSDLSSEYFLTYDILWQQDFLDQFFQFKILSNIKNCTVISVKRSF